MGALRLIWCSISRLTCIGAVRTYALLTHKPSCKYSKCFYSRSNIIIFCPMCVDVADNFTTASSSVVRSRISHVIARESRRICWTTFREARCKRISHATKLCGTWHFVVRQRAAALHTCIHRVSPRIDVLMRTYAHVALVCATRSSSNLSSETVILVIPSCAY